MSGCEGATPQAQDPRALAREALEWADMADRVGGKGTQAVEYNRALARALLAALDDAERLRSAVAAIAPDDPDDGNGWCMACSGNLTYKNLGPYHEPNCMWIKARALLAPSGPAAAREPDAGEAT